MQVDDIQRSVDLKVQLLGIPVPKISVEFAEPDGFFSIERPIELYKQPDQLLVVVRNYTSLSDETLEREIEFEACTLANQKKGIARQLAVVGTHPFRRALGTNIQRAYVEYHAAKRMAHTFGINCLTTYQRLHAPGIEDTIRDRITAREKGIALLKGMREIEDTPTLTDEIGTLMLEQGALVTHLFPLQAVSFALEEKGIRRPVARVPPVLRDICSPLPQCFTQINALPYTTQQASLRNAQLVALVGSGMYEHVDLLGSYLDGQFKHLPGGLTTPDAMLRDELASGVRENAKRIYDIILAAYGMRGAIGVLPKHLN